MPFYFLVNMIKRKKLFAYAAKFSHIEDSLKKNIDESEFQSEVLCSRCWRQELWNRKTFNYFKLRFLFRFDWTTIFFPNLYLSHEAFKKAKSDGVSKVFNGCDGDTVVSHGFEYYEELFLRLNGLSFINKLISFQKM